MFTSLATDRRVAEDEFELPHDEVMAALEAGDPARVLPDVVRIVGGIRELSDVGTVPRSEGLQYGPLPAAWAGARQSVEQTGSSAVLAGQWFRPELAVEAVATERHLVLLGAPGSGKSTVLRYLAVELAEVLRQGGERVDLRGWEGVAPLPVPLFCQLGKVGKELGDDPGGDREILVDALLEPVEGRRLREGLAPKVLRAWSSGGALLCLDGLDEVSGIREATTEGQLSRRERIASAIDWLRGQIGRSRIVVTCRTKPYEESATWQLREGWALRTLQQFEFGQVRYFVPAWYAQTCGSTEAKHAPDEAEDRAERLVDTLERREQRLKLRDLTESPLLLTMLALLDYNSKELPERRVDVYEELVVLLLERWEGVRSGEVDRRQSFGERLGLPTLHIDELRAVVHEIAFEAHGRAVDGRGVLSLDDVRKKLDPFFARQIDPDNAGEVPREAYAAKTDRFILMLREETGLLQEEDEDTYALPHLTFEEYLAACHLAAEENVDLVYEQWRTAPDRWREVVLLFMGRLLKQDKFTLASAWLQLLVAQGCGTEPKTAVERQRDALLAAPCYTAIGRRKHLGEKKHLDVVAFEGRLRSGLAQVLEGPVEDLPLAQRMEAGAELGILGDPRFPVTLDEWRGSLERRNERFGKPEGYWCYVRPGRYRIGGWHGDEPSAEIELPGFWIAKFPLTVAQYAPFVDVGYGAEAQGRWTPLGWRWMVDEKRTQPWGWNDRRFTGRNQPVIGVTWYEATAWAAWMSEQLSDLLPRGFAVRLPTEAEWEAAAAYDAETKRRPYPWGPDDPTVRLAIFDEAKLDRTAPVGVCPAGVAACGALDLAGNVWECATSDYAGYPDRSAVVAEDFERGETRVSWRGGAHRSGSPQLRCGARGGGRPGVFVFYYFYGFRVVVAPRLACLS